MAIPQQKYYDENRGPDLRRHDGNGGSPNRWVVSEMWDAHHEIARYIVMGWKNVDIAKAMNVSSQMVSIVRNSPVVQEHIVIMRDARDADTVDLAKEIEEVAPDALALLKDIVRGDNEGANAGIALRAREANNMLARVGHGVPHKIQAETVNYHLTSKDITEIKRRAQLAKNVVPDQIPEAEVNESI